MVLLVFVVASITLYLNWDKWFGDLPEPDYHLPPTPARVFLLPDEDASTSRKITWVSGDSLGFRLRLTSPTDSTGKVFSPRVHHIETGGGTTFGYSVSLTSLSRGSQYRYSILSPKEKTDAPDERVLYENHFTMPDSSLQEERFVFIGDIQDTEPGGTGDFIREVAISTSPSDAWIFAGDQIQRPHDRFWQIFYNDVATVAGSMPFIPVAGNHEYEMGLNFDLDDRWQYVYDMPTNGPATPEGISYYIDYTFARIVVLDTNIYAWYFHDINRWLRAVLSERKDRPFLIVVGHHPIFSVRKGRKNRTVTHALSPLMEELGVDLYLAGHDHAYARNASGDVTHIVSSSSAKTYPVGDPSKHIVSTSGERYYVTLCVSRDSLGIRSYVEGRPDTPFDSLFLTHNRKPVK